MSNHLLPANATALEITLSEAIDIAHLEAGAEAIRRFKAEPPDSALPSLVWEYALEELLPYLPEPRLAIREGVLWQRLRGTPRSLAVALSWIGAEAVFVEQEAPGGAHWAEFQIDPGRWLEWEEIGRFIAVARLSAPARSRLARIYHGHDRRRLILGQSALDEALLSDYSGTFWRDGATRVSFGRRHDAGQTLWALAASGMGALRAMRTAAFWMRWPWAAGLRPTRGSSMRTRMSARKRLASWGGRSSGPSARIAKRRSRSPSSGRWARPTPACPRGPGKRPMRRCA